MIHSSRSLLFFIFSLITTSLFAQPDMHLYEKPWEGQLTANSNFSLPLTVSIAAAGNAVFYLKGQTTLQRSFKINKDGRFNLLLPENVRFMGIFDRRSHQLTAFIHSGQWQYHIEFKQERSGNYTGKWNILLNATVARPFFLSVENGKGQQYEAYAFSGEAGFSGFACYDFKLLNGTMLFKDARTGLTFNGTLAKNTIKLKIRMAGIPVGEVALHPSVKDWDLQQKLPTTNIYTIPQNRNDGIEIQNISNAGIAPGPLKLMADSINAGKITNTHSVLISRNGKLVFEQYFQGYNAFVPHDMRSASKSISSALIGIAIDQKLISDTSAKLYDLLPPRYQHLMEGKKKAISIGSLLTMSSGLDAIDFGINRPSPGSEDNYQGTEDWAATVLRSPMINHPGTHALYSSANPFLLGKVLNFRITTPLELYIDKYLFEPLKIRNYIIQSDEKDQPYFGGGMYLTPRDMLKFGLMYANGGVFNGKQVVSGDWVKASFKNYLKLENHVQQNGYGFLWWHYQYNVNGKTVKTVEARGAGGQYIFIVPEYDLVVVITSGNFRNGRVWQPEKILENYILPAVIKK